MYLIVIYLLNIYIIYCNNVTLNFFLSLNITFFILTMKRTKSPCISLCKFSGKNGWCLGCGRTLKECKDWKSMKPYARKYLLNDLNKRMIILSNKLKVGSYKKN